MKDEIEIFNISEVNNGRHGTLETNRGKLKFVIRGANKLGRWDQPGQLYVIDAAEEIPAIFNSKFTGAWARVRFDKRSKIAARRAAQRAVELFFKDDD